VGALGYTQQMPTEDRYLLQRQELHDRLAVLLGGRAAEELVFDEISTGAGNDLERASDIARRMVVEFGMSPIVGPVNLSRQRNPMFLDVKDSGDGGGGRGFSEATAQVIDEEVRRISNEAYGRAVELLRGERDLLEALAQMLLEQEVVDRDELRTLMGRPAVEEGDEKMPELGHIPDDLPEAAD